MKRNILLSTLALAGILLTASCNSNTSTGDKTTDQMAKEAVESDKVQDLTGTFTVDGKEYTGRISTQLFPSTKEYSVLCQDDTDPNHSALLQLIFKDEASARIPGAFTVIQDNVMSAGDANEVAITFDNTYNADKGTLTVSKDGGHHMLQFSGVTTKNMSKEQKTVSGKLPY